jgi:hypothetical protein
VYSDVCCFASAWNLEDGVGTIGCLTFLTVSNLSYWLLLLLLLLLYVART